jgi:HSP20 family protein
MTNATPTQEAPTTAPTKEAGQEVAPKATTRPRVLGWPDLRDEMDRLWDAVMTAPWRPFQAMRQPQIMPAIDVFEKEGALHVRAELPGMSEKDVEVNVSGDALTISGEKKEEREVKEENYYRSERTYGKFSRRIALPPGADADQAKATFKNGVLEVDVPVRPVAGGEKKIEIAPGA